MFTTGSRIKELRTLKSSTQDELAALLQVNRATISNYERDIITIPSDKLAVLADFFNTSADYILGRSDDPTPPVKQEQVDALAIQSNIDNLTEIELENIKHYIEFLRFQRNKK